MWQYDTMDFPTFNKFHSRRHTCYHILDYSKKNFNSSLCLAYLVSVLLLVVKNSIMSWGLKLTFNGQYIFISKTYLDLYFIDIPAICFAYHYHVNIFSASILNVSLKLEIFFSNKYYLPKTACLHRNSF